MSVDAITHTSQPLVCNERCDPIEEFVEYDMQMLALSYGCGPKDLAKDYLKLCRKKLPVPTSLTNVVTKVSTDPEQGKGVLQAIMEEISGDLLRSEMDEAARVAMGDFEAWCRTRLHIVNQVKVMLEGTPAAANATWPGYGPKVSPTIAMLAENPKTHRRSTIVSTQSADDEYFLVPLITRPPNPAQYQHCPTMPVVKPPNSSAGLGKPKATKVCKLRAHDALPFIGKPPTLQRAKPLPMFMTPDGAHTNTNTRDALHPLGFLLLATSWLRGRGTGNPAKWLSPPLPIPNPSPPCSDPYTSSTSKNTKGTRLIKAPNKANNVMPRNPISALE